MKTTFILEKPSIFDKKNAAQFKEFHELLMTAKITDDPIKAKRAIAESKYKHFPIINEFSDKLEIKDKDGDIAIIILFEKEEGNESDGLSNEDREHYKRILRLLELNHPTEKTEFCPICGKDRELEISSIEIAFETKKITPIYRCKVCSNEEF